MSRLLKQSGLVFLCAILGSAAINMTLTLMSPGYHISIHLVMFPDICQSNVHSLFSSNLVSTKNIWLMFTSFQRWCRMTHFWAFSSFYSSFCLFCYWSILVTFWRCGNKFPRLQDIKGFLILKLCLPAVSIRQAVYSQFIIAFAY